MTAPALEPAQIAPHSQDAEEAVHGSILINPDAFIEVAMFLKSEDFFILRNAWIWEAMCRLYKRGVLIDYLTVIEELRAQDRLDDVGGPAYITYLTSNIGTSVYAETYARIVQRAAIRRRMLDASAEIARLAREEESDIHEVITRAQVELDKVTSAAVVNDWQHVSNVVDNYFDVVESRRLSPGTVRGILTGLNVVDDALRGLQPGRLYIVAARPKMGKTWFLLFCALAAARAGYRVGIMSLEMTRDQLINRLISLITGINSRRIDEGDLSNAEWSQFVAAVSELADLPIFIDDSGWQSPTSIRHKAKRLKARHGLDILFFDYIQMAQDDEEAGKKKDSSYQRVTAISMTLAALTKPDALNIPIVAASQLSRGVEARADKHPIPSDLRESGQIEQDASAVLFLYRDYVYHPDVHEVIENGKKLDVKSNPNLCEIGIPFNRHNGGIGGTGWFDVWYDIDCPNFDNADGKLKRHIVHLE